MQRSACFMFFLLFALLTFSRSEAQQFALPVWSDSMNHVPAVDWLLGGYPGKAGLYRSADGKDLVLCNGLLLRRFRITPDLACTDYRNLVNGQELLRAVEAEAVLRIHGTAYPVGGLLGQPEKAYLEPAWVDTLHRDPRAFHFDHYEQKPLKPFLQWESRCWTAPAVKSSGIRVDFFFRSDLPELAGLELVVHYDLYDALPLLVKSLSLYNRGAKVFHLDRVENERLALVEEESAVVGSPAEMKKQHGLYVETNYAFNNAMRYDISDQTTHWNTDSSYTSQVNYNFKTPCLLEVYPEYAPGIDLGPGEDFHSVRTCELLMDSYDRERRGLAIRQMYRAVAPWIRENPIFMHLVSHNDAEVKAAIDQCVATGYEAVILSFGSHLNMEDSSAANIRRWKELADYAHQHHILIGGYSLFSSRHISDTDDVLSPVTGKPGGAFFGYAPCYGSYWGLAYRDKIKHFFSTTGFDIWENDGPYPGDRCASTTHPGHKGLDDSQWRQMEIQKELYHWLNERGVYINAPDWYFMDGTNKTGIGYREVNFSLPRDRQKILNRQNIYDGTWEKTPSMGWGFVPLTRYQGGGPEAVLEPLHEHIPDYRQLMFQYYGAGVQACYRGPRLYDTDSTRRMVSGVIAWYKKYRDVLNGDIIHLRRADGRDWDGILHVSPGTALKGMLVLFNPLDHDITRQIRVPLYYTGLSHQALLRRENGPARSYSLDRDYQIIVNVRLKAGGYTWFTIQ